MRGRVFAVEFTLYTLAEGGSAFLAGYLLDHVSYSLTQCCWGLTLAAAVAVVVWSGYAYWQRHNTQGAFEPLPLTVLAPEAAS